MEHSSGIKIPFSGWKYAKRLGSGGFGSVYEIHREQLGFTEKSAMKVISIPKDPAVIDADRSDGYDEASIRRKYEDCLKDVVSEYKLMQQLHGHSNIVDCQDLYFEKQTGTIGWNVYIRMELLTPLKDYISAGGMTETAVITLGKDICRALTACAGMKIIHRDIKPENIMVSRFGFKLGDFGIARTLDHTTNATVIGTERYMAPEVILRKKYGREADIYSLGLVLYWLLNNRRMPFWPQGSTPPGRAETAEAQVKRIQGAPMPPPVHGSAALKQAVMKACAYRPEERYGSAGEMLKALENLTTESSGKTPPAEEKADNAFADGFSYETKEAGTEPVFDGEKTAPAGGNNHSRTEKINDQEETSPAGGNTHSRTAKINPSGSKRNTGPKTKPAQAPKKKKKGVAAGLLLIFLAVCFAIGFFSSRDSKENMPTVECDDNARAWEEVYADLTSEKALESPVDYANGSYEEIRDALSDLGWTIDEDTGSKHRFNATYPIEKIYGSELDEKNVLKIEVTVYDNFSQVQFEDDGLVFCEDYPYCYGDTSVPLPLIKEWKAVAPTLVTSCMYDDIVRLTDASEDMLTFADAEADDKLAYCWKDDGQRYSIDYHTETTEEDTVRTHLTFNQGISNTAFFGNNSPMELCMIQSSYHFEEPGISEIIITYPR